MTKRSVLVGLLGAAAVCGFVFFNDQVIRQTRFVADNFPFSVYGTLILFILLANPLIAKMKKRWMFTSKELAVVLTLTLVGASIPGVSFLQPLITCMIVPQHARSDTGFRASGIIDKIPGEMQVISEDDSVVTGFIMGSDSSREFSISDVPWSAWLPSLGYWIPLFLLLFVALIALSVVIHKQWAEHEHLPYPIAQFTDSILPKDGEPISGVFLTRIFWIGAGVVFGIHMLNYVHAWWPDYTFAIPTQFDLSPIQNSFDSFDSFSNRLFRPRILFTVIAIAYFLAADVSISVSIGPWIFVLFMAFLKSYGFWYSGGYYTPKIGNSMLSGAYVGVMLTIIYTGRHYYLNVCRQAFGLRTPETVAKETIWSARIFFLCTVLFMIDLIATGLSWPLAIVFTLLMIGLFTVLSRVMVESGIFFINTFWSPGVVVLTLFGLHSMGITAGIIMFLISSVLVTETRGSLMPMVVNSLGLLKIQNVKIGRTALCMLLALIIGLTVAVPVALYFHYDRGTQGSAWTNRIVPRLTFWSIVPMQDKLEAQGKLEEAENSSGFERIANMSPDLRSLTYFSIGLVLVVVCAGMRLRFPNWWIHPVMFVVWGTFHAQLAAASFCMGWLLEVCLTKYGGVKSYHAFKPFMLGLIAGDMTAGVVMSIIGAIYYFITGEIPDKISIMA